MGSPTYDQIMDEARRRRQMAGYGPGANLGSPPLEHFIIETVRENWTPPPPPADPDLLAVREIVAREWEKWCDEHQLTEHYGPESTRSGRCDRDHSVRAALAAYRAGRSSR